MLLGRGPTAFPPRTTSSFEPPVRGSRVVADVQNYPGSRFSALSIATITTAAPDGPSAPLPPPLPPSVFSNFLPRLPSPFPSFLTSSRHPPARRSSAPLDPRPSRNQRHTFTVGSGLRMVGRAAMRPTRRTGSASEVERLHAKASWCGPMPGWVRFPRIVGWPGWCQTLSRHTT